MTNSNFFRLTHISSTFSTLLEGDYCNAILVTVSSHPEEEY